MRTLTSLLASLFFAALTAGAQDVEELIRQGDKADRAFATREALEAYLAAAELQPNHPGINIRIARQYRHLMTDAATPAEKKQWADLALDYSRRAALAAPGSADAQIATGITYGKMLDDLDNAGKVEASRAIKASADRALALDPRNDTALYVLGRWHQGMADLQGVRRTLAQVRYGAIPNSTYGEAAECFEKARRIAPERLMHTVELGIVYGKMGYPDRARALLTEAVSMPLREKDDARNKARARQALASLR